MSYRSRSSNRQNNSSNMNNMPHPPPPVQRHSVTPNEEGEEEDVVIIQGDLNVSLSQGIHQANAANTTPTGCGTAGKGADSKMNDTPTKTDSKKEEDDEHTTNVAVAATPPVAVMVPANNEDESAAGAAAVCLPDTVTVLEGPNGSKVYLVGTAHFSTQSQNDVRATISLVRPSVVVLELCDARRDFLTLDEETILKEAKYLSFATLRASGVQGLLHFLLLSMSAQLTRKLGMAPGGEFRAADSEARNINNNCLVILGDRPLDVTIKRAMSSLTFLQKLKLVYHFVVSFYRKITKEDIERLKERDLLEKLLSELTGEFPSFVEVLINERDTFLAHSLLLATLQAAYHQQQRQQQQEGYASDAAASGEGAVVVGVVGISHVKGITAKFRTTTIKDVQNISMLPDCRRGVVGVGSLVRYAIFGAVAYSAYQFGIALWEMIT